MYDTFLLKIAKHKINQTQSCIDFEFKTNKTDNFKHRSEHT